MNSGVRYDPRFTRQDPIAFETNEYNMQQAS